MIEEALANVQNIPKTGIRAIKQMELATKWRPLVPEEYRDSIRHIPPKEIIEKYRKEKCKKKGKLAKAKFEKMKVLELKEELRKLKLSTTGLKNELISRLTTEKILLITVTLLFLQ